MVIKTKVKILTTENDPPQKSKFSQNDDNKPSKSDLNTLDQHPSSSLSSNDHRNPVVIPGKIIEFKMDKLGDHVFVEKYLGPGKGVLASDGVVYPARFVKNVELKEWKANNVNHQIEIAILAILNSEPDFENELSYLEVIGNRKYLINSDIYIADFNILETNIFRASFDNNLSRFENLKKEIQEIKIKKEKEEQEIQHLQEKYGDNYKDKDEKDD